MSKTLKYIIMALLVVVMLVIATIIYRMFFLFNIKEIEIYAREEAEKYGKDSKEVYMLILEGVEYVLASHNLTQQVLRSARGTNTDPEQELVNAAINQCMSFGYLART